MSLNTLSEIPDILPNHYVGKVRDTFDLNDGRMVFITSDRLSAFDRAITSVPHKGAVLNGIAKFWFDRTTDIIPNHVISYPDPNVMIVKKLNMLPVEVVVRRYMTGTTGTSIWTKYKNGERKMYGHVFPEGMIKNQKLASTIITPTTKGKTDDPISRDEIISSGLVSRELWEKTEEAALKLFARAEEIASKLGLIFVDTKYEFGTDEDGNLYVADEINTPDSSRYWIAATYAERFNNGEDPEGLDKEFVRKWLVARMDDAYKDPIPDITPEIQNMFSRKYLDLFNRVTGVQFVTPDTSVPIIDRITSSIKLALPEPG